MTESRSYSLVVLFLNSFLLWVLGVFKVLNSRSMRAFLKEVPAQVHEDLVLRGLICYAQYVEENRS